MLWQCKIAKVHARNSDDTCGVLKDSTQNVTCFEQGYPGMFLKQRKLEAVKALEKT